MANFDDNSDIEEEKTVDTPKNNKKIVLIIVPILVIIGIIVGIYVVANKEATFPDEVTVVKKQNNQDNETLVLFDLPEVNIQINDGENGFGNVRIKINIEVSKTADIDYIEDLMPKILDSIISYSASLSFSDMSGSKGLYWLREELLYRINMIVDPVKVHNLNFKTFEIRK